ncbi:hypothetical protein [Marinomonas gallaica]|uniref:hypothetical protein n=1 Tax=Marinomonas gallaica TaxID=1806667 RepID=UPI003A91D749
MSETTQQLAQYGISLEEARAFIYGNLDSPQTIYQVTAEYNITFSMIAEIYGQGVNQEQVKAFFHDQGMVANQPAPLWDEDYRNGDYDTMYGRPELDIDEVLGLSQTQIANSDWNTLINQYIEALSNYDWSAWDNNITAALNKVDWESWSEQTNNLALNNATDGSWVSQLNALIEPWANFDLESVFNYSDDSVDRFDEYANDYDLATSDYKAYVERLFAELGLSNDEMLDIYSSLFENVDLGSMLESLELAEAELANYMEQFNNLYSAGGSIAPEQQSVELLGINYIEGLA